MNENGEDGEDGEDGADASSSTRGGAVVARATTVLRQRAAGPKTP